MTFLKDKRIFIVEDDVYNIAVISTMLQQKGAVIASERWGTQTIERLEAFSPVDLILLDLMFPAGVSGYQLFDMIRSIDSFKHIPIVAVTASDSDSALKKVKAHGFNGFIRKPVRFGVFERQVSDVLDGKEIWDDTEQLLR